MIQLDLGETKRQVIAGIAKHFAPDDLIGQQVTMVFNLAPRKLFGLESQGMILAVDGADGGLGLLRPTSPAKPGTRVS